MQDDFVSEHAAVGLHAAKRDHTGRDPLRCVDKRGFRRPSFRRGDTREHSVIQVTPAQPGGDVRDPYLRFRGIEAVTLGRDPSAMVQEWLVRVAPYERADVKAPASPLSRRSSG